MTAERRTIPVRMGEIRYEPGTSDLEPTKAELEMASMTELPDDVREFLESLDTAFPLVHRMLAKYPKPQPEWQDGDVALDIGQPFYCSEGNWWQLGGPPQQPLGSSWVTAQAELVIRAGRRVHPARFADHAKVLSRLADELESNAGWPDRAEWVRAIAADLAGDSDD